MTYSEAVAFLYERLPMFQRIGAAAFKKDLSNIRALCSYLGHPERAFKSIHIAGTNGKGSTAHTLSAVLQSAGYKTGLYTSPHLKSFTERIRIDGQAIDETSVIDFVSAHRQAILDIEPSFFEVSVAMAFDYFAKSGLDIAVIEVGMGGRLDSTNIITPELSVITRIGLDHQQFLGDSLDKIAGEKAGIIKPGVPVVISVDQDETRDVFLEKAKIENAPIFFASDEIELFDITGLVGGHRFSYRIKNGGGVNDLFFGLAGDYQRYNLPGILAAVNKLREMGYQISDEALRHGLKDVCLLTGLKGRWQILQQEPLVIADTGHNEDGITSNLAQLNSLSFERMHFVLGFVNDKDISKILGMFPKNASYYFTQADIPRALPVEQLHSLAKKLGLEGQCIPDVNKALAVALDAAGKNDIIYVGGSTFVVAEIEAL